MIWIDQPAGTGYSVLENSEGYITSEEAVAADVYSTLLGFLSLHPEYTKNLVYIFGESYAGKYIPYVSHYIWQQNKKLTSPIKINLQGLAMGDGWVQPYYQTGSFAPFLYSHDLINEFELESAQLSYDAYKALMDAGLYVIADEVGNALLETLVLAAGDVDVYDIRYVDDPTDPLSDQLQSYLSSSSVMVALHANQTWLACDNAGLGLLDDMERSAAYLIPDLLTSYSVMNYNGNYDLICNLMGTNTWTSNLKWPGQQAFNNAQNHTWVVAGQTAGYYKSAQGFTHVVVYNAGHMSPFNQPRNTQDMLYRFISGGFKP